MVKTKMTIVLVGAVLMSCNLGESYGYVPTSAEIQQIQPGTDNKASVEARFGPPTVLGETESMWYYVSSRRQFPAFLPTREVERRVLALRFEDDVVAGVTEFGQEQGQDIAISRYTTETGGRVLTIWEQLYGSVGNLSAEQFVSQSLSQ